jgi:hypothetical protein
VTETVAPTRILFGWPRHQGGVVHAVVDRYRDPDDSMTEFEIRGRRLIGHSGDPHPWLRHVSALCGSGAGMELFRVTPDNEFSPEGPAGDMRGRRVCEACTRRWSAEYAESMSGWVKMCSTCDESLPVNKFRSDARTADGLARTCESCTTMKRRLHRQLSAIEKRAGHLAKWESERVAAAKKVVAVLELWQASPWLPAHRCSAGHRVVAEVIGDQPAWLCQCGSAPVDEGVRSIAWQMAHASTDMLSDSSFLTVQMPE